MPLKLEHRKDELSEMYLSGKSFYQIAKEIGEYEQAVAAAIRLVLDIPKKKNLFIDENYFEKIDSVDKAYFFGLIAADGAIVNNGAGIMTMTISLQEEDRHILESLKRQTKAEVTIKEYKQSYQKEDGQLFIQSRFVTANQAFVQHLVNHGIIERKSLSLGRLLQEVEEPYRMDFIRGYFDGNGSIFETVTSGKRDRHYCSIRGTEDILTDMKEYLLIEGGKIHWSKGSTSGTGQYQWRFGAREDIRRFRDMIYHESVDDYYLVRKKVKFPW